MSKYLDEDGLLYFWNKIKERLNSKTDALPIVFENEGSHLLDYRIYGNTGGVGDLTLLPNCLENNVKSETINGLSITINGQNITVNGIATANTNIVIYNGAHTLSTSAYQIIENGIYELSGSPEGSGVGTGHYILSYNYDDAIGGTPAYTSNRVPTSGVTIDNTNGNYRYLCVYIAIWKGAELNNVVFTPSLRKQAYKIPVSCGGVITDIFIDSPLNKGEYIAMSDTSVPIPTFKGINTLDILTTTKPEGIYVNFNTYIIPIFTTNNGIAFSVLE